MQDDTRTVVLAAGNGVVLKGDFERYEAIRGKKSRVGDVQALALHPGMTVLHRIDFQWMSNGLEQRASLPSWKELSAGGGLSVLTPDILEKLANDIYDGTDTEGFMSDDERNPRRAVFHFVTPSGPVQLPLQYWQVAGRRSGTPMLFFDLSRSESA